MKNTEKLVEKYLIKSKAKVCVNFSFFSLLYVIMVWSFSQTAVVNFIFTRKLLRHTNETIYNDLSYLSLSLLFLLLLSRRPTPKYMHYRVHTLFTSKTIRTQIINICVMHALWKEKKRHVLWSQRRVVATIFFYTVVVVIWQCKIYGFTIYILFK